MFTPTAAPASALTKSSPYNGPRGQPGPHETNPTFASWRNRGSRTTSRDPTITSAPPNARPTAAGAGAGAGAAAGIPGRSQTRDNGPGPPPRGGAGDSSCRG